MRLEDLHKHFSPFPVNKDKSPKGMWSVYREKKIPFEQLQKHNRFGIVCGYDNLEIVDVDNHFDDAEAMLGFIRDNMSFDLPIVKTQGGGYHLYYKCEVIEGSQKLAMRINPKGRPETLVETKGVGGYIVAPPTEGYNVIEGDILKVPTITVEQREELLTICRSLNEVEVKKEKNEPRSEETDSPGTKYNQDSESVSETIFLLEKHGWESRDRKHWKRPGKDTKGISATFGKVGVNKFYVFSSNAYPFEMNTSYSMFGVRAILEHGGNYSDCAKALAERYGMKKNAQKKKPEPKPEMEKVATGGKWGIFKEIIDDWGLEFRFNELMKVMEYRREKGRWQQLGLLQNDIVHEMEVNRGVKTIGLQKINDMMHSTYIAKVYNPIKSFFDGIEKWDGKDHIAELCKFIKLQNDENEVFFEMMLKKHLIRSLKCAYEEDYVNRIVFVLYSQRQEIGKTMFWKWLSPLKDLYDDEEIDPGNKDSMLKLGRYFWINLEELDHLQKKDIAKLKAFISKGDVKQRVAYGRFDEKFIRVASFCGSTNRNDILADDSNTRWMILRVKDFDWKGYTKSVNKAQVWAQVWAMYQQDPMCGELTADEKRIRDVRNNQMFLEVSQEREILQKWFDEGDYPMTATDIKLSIEKHLMPTKINMHQLVRELRRLYGEAQCTTANGKPGRYYMLDNRLEIKPISEDIFSVRKDFEF